MITGGTNGLTKTGSGTLTLSGTNTYAGGTVVNNGSLVLASTTALKSNTSLGITGSGSVQVAGTGGVLQVSSLNITGSGKLDLDKHDLIWHNGDVSTVTSWLDAGYSGGTWNDTSNLPAITSSTYTTGYGFGVLSGAVYLGIYGQGAQFDEVTVSPSDVLVKYTLLGDTTLKGYVDATDFAQLDAAYLMGLYATGGATWINGDCNYDGQITNADYAAMNASFQLSQSGGGQATQVPPTGVNTITPVSQTRSNSPLSAGSTNAPYAVLAVALVFAEPDATATDSSAISITPTPEPGTLGIASVGLLAFLRKRKRTSITTLRMRPMTRA